MGISGSTGFNCESEVANLAMMDDGMEGTGAEEGKSPSVFQLEGTENLIPVSFTTTTTATLRITLLFPGACLVFLRDRDSWSKLAQLIIKAYPEGTPLVHP